MDRPFRRYCIKQDALVGLLGFHLLELKLFRQTSVPNFKTLFDDQALKLFQRHAISKKRSAIWSGGSFGCIGNPDIVNIGGAKFIGITQAGQ